MFNKYDLLEKLFKSGAHFGHKTRFCHPKMKNYIYTKHNDIHIIDLETTVKNIKIAIKKLKHIINNNGQILFVGTKNVVKDKIKETAIKLNQHYINKRWLGGMLTNWKVVQKLIKKFLQQEKDFLNDKFKTLKKKEKLTKLKHFEKIKANINGIKRMTKLPDALFVIDSKKEHLAVKEAFKLNIPTFGIVDTDSNPDWIDYVIPSNDDSAKTINLYLNLLDEQLSFEKK